MSSVGIHPPKTPATKGCLGTAKATLPNVCKMPGPPAPFVPSPLPNIAKSEMSPKGYSKKVKIESNTVAIRGASFKSMGDMASKGTGGGLISANTHGPAKFITPGSPTVKIEGKSVHLLGEPMLNNCGPSGNPPNTGATLMGLDQSDIKEWIDLLQQYVNDCDIEGDEQWDKDHPDGPKHNDCDKDTERKFTSGPDKGKPMPVKVAISNDKHTCVYKKMKVAEQVPEYNDKEESVTVEQYYDLDGKRLPPYIKMTGSISPDVIYRSADDAIVAIRELKFRCPKGVKETHEDKVQIKEYTRRLKAPAKIVQPSPAISAAKQLVLF